MTSNNLTTVDAFLQQYMFVYIYHGGKVVQQDSLKQFVVSGIIEFENILIFKQYI